jgi:hypothetical protein
MCKKLVFLISFVLLLGLANRASAALVAHWSFDDNATDSVGALNGTLNGGASFYTDAREGSHSLRLDGVDGYVSATAAGPLLVPFSTQTVTLWFRADSTSGTQVLYDEGGSTNGLAIRVNNNRLEAAAQDNHVILTTGTPFNSTDWTHVAVTFDNGELTLYVSGEPMASATAGFTSVSNHSNIAGIGARAGQGAFDNGTTGHYFGGLIDDVRIYDNVLSTAEIGDLAGDPWPYAYGPVPQNGALYDDNTWVNLMWSAGSYAVSHDVYVGGSFDDVAAGTPDTFQGNQQEAWFFVGLGTPGDPYPGGFVASTTYYWRIDEIAADGTKYEGDVWSFTIPPKTAYRPLPADGAKFIDPDGTLSWMTGFGAVYDDLYFGDNRADVEAGTGDTAKGMVYTTSFAPGTLELDKTYYWRVDAYDGAVTHQGEVWSFRTLPEITITDPNLVGWWKLDEGVGTRALDWSGHENHGTLAGNLQWTVDGYDGGSLDFSNSGYVAIQNLYYAGTSYAEVTVCAWIRTSSGADQYIASFDRDNYWRLEINGSGAGAGQVGWDVMTDAGQNDYGSVRRVDDGQWHHVCGVFDNGRSTIYIDGYPEPSTTVGTTFGNANTRYGFIGANSEATGFDGGRGSGSPVSGDIDDLRIYDVALTQEQIRQAMRGDPRLAWDPSPGNRSTPNIDDVKPLSWSPGDFAAQHDVYLGTDQDAVENAGTSDTTGIYRAQQTSTSYNPPEALEFGKSYYWRIDENNTDGTISKGRVWSFTVADFLLIDEFEAYDANDNQIWYAWRDGLGYGAVANPPYYAGNGTGAEVGDSTTESYAEENITHGGDLAMPYWYNNNKPGYFKYSEAAMTIPAGLRDWTRQDVKALSLWFRGYPESASTFTEGPPGTYTMTARCGNIFGTSDQLNYVFMQLSGPGSISAKVESVSNTAADSKCGVMIRDTLEADSKHAFTFMRFDGGVRFNRRLDVAVATTNSVENGLTFPHWVKLERDISGLFTASHSADGVTWVPVDDATLGSSDTVQMNVAVYIGLALSSNDTAETCEAVFSDVQVSGQVTGQWQSQDIGILSNDPEPMYVAVANTSGTTAVVYHDDPNATQIETWTEWNIELKDFADQGVNLSDVNSVAIGFGDRNNPQAGGSGKMYFDDIRVYRPRCIPSLLKHAADFSNNCVVDMADLEIMADDWLASGYDVTVVAASDANLAGHYELDGNASDSSGNGRHGTVIGNPQWVSGHINSAVQLDGAADSVVYSFAAAEGWPACTVALWARTDTLAQNVNSSIFSGHVPNTAGFQLDVDGSIPASYRVNPGGMLFGPVSTDWVHIAVVCDNTVANLYYNGARTGSGTVTATDTTFNQFAIGLNRNADNWFAGDLDDVRIYERSLSQTEIANLAGVGAGAVFQQPVLGLLSTTADSDLHDDEKIDFKDFAALIDVWLDELLWPAP